MKFREVPLWWMLLLVALAVRLPALPAALPYLTYVDEGHVLHRSAHLLAAHTWEPDNYSYPSLPFYLVAGGALAWSPVYALQHGHALSHDVAEPWTFYDVVEPVDLIVIGRLLTLAFSLALVLLTGLLAGRLAGPAAGLAAGWLAAWVPALVVRGTVVNVNPQAACFAVAALFFAEGARAGEHPRRDALLAGTMAGLAGASKYPVALVVLPVGLAAALALPSWRERILRLGLAAGAALLAAAVAMPALVLRPAAVAAGLHEMDVIYTHQPAGSYWQQAFQRAEWDLPLEHPEVGFAFAALTVA
ncbi:MAG TPA: glycosyltransferase family 39 protein, partial [Thermoanaerobaculia bacterium]|nr:glycosyltransferase family 39 protein [Thermoanaerobaculia bacterium]